jgi:hypothetical protein
VHPHRQKPFEMNNGEALPETSDMATEEFLVIKRS